ncbi:uncharacterized protein LOC134414970 [Melospiza melodia melodia]|uniref:uncharacterized protein LOC134414970 n=1 Tax=Melospiza melodia melodia TaxID=1914991 RepID=UPI002FCF1A25
MVSKIQVPIGRPENTERRRLALRRRVLPAGGGPCAAANGSPRPATLRGRTTPRVAPDLAPKARAWRRGDGALSSASNQSDYKARPSRILIGYSARTDFSNNQSDAAKGWRFELRREGSAAVYRVEGGWRCKRLFFMEFDPKIQKRMRRSSKRFNACLNRILEEYTDPFRDDVEIPLSSLTYDTPRGPRSWEDMTRRGAMIWKEAFMRTRQQQRRRERQSHDLGDENSPARQESSENTGAVTSDTGERGADVASVGRNFEGINLKVPTPSSSKSRRSTLPGQELLGERGADVASVGRNFEGINLKVPTPSSSKSRRSTLPGQELLGEEGGDVASVGRKFEGIHLKVPTPSSSKSRRSTLPGQELLGEEGGDVASVGRKFEGIHLKNLNVDDGQNLKKKRVPVDVILQGDERNIPKWITIPTSSSKSRRSTLPGQELLGPKRQDRTSRKDAKTCKKGFTRTRQQQRRREKQSHDLGDENSPARQESSENSGADTSDTGEEGGDVASVGRKFEGIHLKNLNVDDGQNLKKKRVPVDVILQGDERNIPKWITIPTSSSKSRRSTLPGQELLGPKRQDRTSRKDAKTCKKGFTRTRQQQRRREKQSHDLGDENSPARQESSENSGADTSDTGEEGGDVASVGRKFEGIHLKNLNVDDGQNLKKKRVPVDVILQGDERNIPKWITIPTSSSKSRRSTLPGQELLGPKRQNRTSRKDAKTCKKGFTRTRQQQRRREKQSHDLGDENSPARQESSENSGADTSDTGEEGGDVASVGRKFEGIHLKIPTSSSKSRRSTLPGQELLGEEGGDVASVGRKFEGIHLKNLNVDDGQNLKKKRVPVDVILQGDERNIPKWITIPTPSSSNSHHSTLPEQELRGNRAGVCRKKLEFSNECSSSKYPQLQHSAVPLPSKTVASPRHRPCPEVNMTSCDSILGGYQSADEGCSFSSTDLSALYPAMVAILAELMTKHSQRKVLKYMFGHLRSKRRHSRRPKLNVTVDKMRESGSCKRKPKKASHSMCSRRSEDNQNPTFGNERREFSSDSCPISNSSALGSYACADTNETKMHYSDSSLEQHLASGKSQEVCKHTAFPDVMDRMEETFLVEDKLQTIASPKNSEYIEGEKFTYKLFSEPSFRTSAASSDSRAFHLVKESKTQKADFCVGTSELCSCACSSHGNRDNSVSTINFSPARSTNTSFIWPQKITSSQHKESFSSWKQNSSKRDEEIDAAFDKLCYRVISGEYFKPSTSTRPLLNSQSHEEKGTLVRSNLSDSERSLKQRDTELEKLCGKSVPKFPGLQRASNFRKYEEIQMPETVNALVNSPVRTYSAISSAKRAGNFQNHPLCSPVKRLKFKPEYCSSSSKCQEISHSKEGNLQTSGMDFLSTYNCSQPSVFADRNFHCQGFGSHDSSQQSSLGISGTSLQESGTAGAHSGWPGAMENRSSLRSGSERHSRVYRKLSYTDGKDQL